MNAGKYKVVVGSSGGIIIINSGTWPCGVCGNGVLLGKKKYVKIKFPIEYIFFIL